MKTIVVRTSQRHHNEVPPCENAVKEQVTIIEMDWGFSTEEMKIHFLPWFQKGRDFHDEFDQEGHLRAVRFLDEERYTLTFDTLEELLDFVRKNGEIIIRPTKEYQGFEWEIEIYDTYRE